MELYDRIARALDECRPHLQTDGGDIRFVSIKENGTLEVQFEGSCAVCPLSPLTLRAGIERTIMHWAPEVKRVECIKAC